MTVARDKPTYKYCLTSPFGMSSMESLYTGLSVGEEGEISSAITVLNKKFGEASTLRFIEGIFKLGFVRALELLRATSMGAAHGEPSDSLISQVTGNAMFETDMASTSSGPGAVPDGAMSDAEIRPGPVMACNCYRKVPYKTARGLREHLVLKHGLGSLEAEVTANLTFHESNRGTIQPHTESNNQQVPHTASSHEVMNDGSHSQALDWEAFFPELRPY